MLAIVVGQPGRVEARAHTHTQPPHATSLFPSWQFEPEYIWKEVSPAAKSFIMSLLRTDPSSRPTSKEALNHAWFDAGDAGEEAGCLSASVVRSLVQFKSYDNLRKLICEIISFTLLQEQIHDLRKEFEKVDKEGLGEISFQGLKEVLEESAKAGNMGSLQEDEIISIFNSLKVSKSASTIHYHEFLAACLSQCELDDRNLKLAFDRMDGERKGYITAQNVADLLGADATEGQVNDMFEEARASLSNKTDKIYFGDFVRLMNGQETAAQRARTPPVQDQDEADFWMMPKITEHTRERSRSLGDKSGSSRDSGEEPFRMFDVGKMMKKRREDSSEANVLSSSGGAEQCVTPLKESRRIYRSHREIRIAIIESSKRFEMLREKREGQPIDVSPAKLPTPVLVLSKVPPRTLAGSLSTVPASPDASFEGNPPPRINPTQSDDAGSTPDSRYGAGAAPEPTQAARRGRRGGGGGGPGLCLTCRGCTSSGTATVATHNKAAYGDESGGCLRSVNWVYYYSLLLLPSRPSPPTPHEHTSPT